ncbi:MAG: aldo/keto reductase [Nocardioides sp.]|uniref:aldo/keto reductase n=1 Tax=Nocardioides sp. TaxID=35761 RepID=UPI003D6BB754
MSTDKAPMGLGTWPLTGDDATSIVRNGIEAGYRLIDTAAVYENEEAVGRGVRESGLRDQLLITSKLRGRDHLSGKIREAVEESLRRLGVERIDLYLIHWPLPRFDRYVVAYQGLLECREAGLLGQVGVSNFLGHHLDRLVEATGEAPYVNQIQLDPTLARTGVRRAADALGVHTQSWSPLGRGDALSAPAVGEIAEQHGATTAQVVLAWHRAHGLTPVVRSSRPERLAENLAALELRLTAEDVGRLDRLDRGEEAARDVETEEAIS